jgi:hypothetical protein
MRQTFLFLALICLTTSASLGQTSPEKPAAPPATPKKNLHAVSVTVTIVEAPPSRLPADESAGTLLKRIKKLEAGGELSSWTRIRLSVVEGTSGFAQFGERTPRVSGRAVARGRTLKSYVLENVGTLVGCTARVVGDTVIAELNVEQSRIVPPLVESDKPADAAVTPPPSAKRTLTTKTSVKIKNGATVVLSGSQITTSDEKSLRTLILVTARILE